MKAVYIAMMAAAGFAMSGQVMADEALAKAKGCLACHDIATQKIGPAYKEVAAKYKGNKDAVALLAKSIKNGTGAGAGWQKAGKAQLPAMPANTTVNEDEAKKLAAWVLTQK
jgi:cytochrome c